MEKERDWAANMIGGALGTPVAGAPACRWRITRDGPFIRNRWGVMGLKHDRRQQKQGMHWHALSSGAGSLYHGDTRTSPWCSRSFPCAISGR
jgi:hypothetical protein